MNKRYQIFSLKNIPTPNFLMTPLELRDYIDFEVKRVYFVSDMTGEKKTGSHCHFSEKELFIMISGSCTLVVDDGSGMEEINFSAPKKAVYIPEKVWHHFKDVSDDAIILALSSTNYNPERSDYCEDYQEFQKIIKE